MAKEGHGPLYDNGKKISRAHGNWVHVPPSATASGADAVGITLNANHLSQWAVDGVWISSIVILVTLRVVADANG